MRRRCTFEMAARRSAGQDGHAFWGEAAVPRTKIFISYRRGDTGPAVRLLSSALKERFGQRAVFVDTEAIDPGARWPRRIDQALTSADVVLVAVGPRWLDITDERGRPRIGRHDDW